MLARLKFFLIFALGTFISTAGLYWIQHQPSIRLTLSAHGQPQNIAKELNPDEVRINLERSDYHIIPLETVNSLLIGSDPATIALNMIDEGKESHKKIQVQVVYPQPNQALVTIIKPSPAKNSVVNTTKYRVEMSRFGRSLLVNSPQVWEVIWAGSQRDCFSQDLTQDDLSQDCD
ncbi:hypothetical protein FHK94_03870 [Cylindrospermopsis raciborskii CS-506_D]|uniref:Uncharacterized protein n=3 Tax=Cylindrospermopsis raciborskii TaxID=77022 RepID=A0A853ML31_9CYAN|nr:hypothetical protein [Cylindrospermopsis raciborskii CS-506_C]MBA4449017.1 hypothetical protein [Cylindrospermopsis raciborskii CS-506_D]MBA4455649.1 hypothetical protein [Cylindrospermopsis raciborskii CS-506_B]MBA4464993.1 hypothetical protein [Cylindrospermopsis raciborskii CS-506_A]OBU77936.1 hypothetical protein A9P98_04565 [Cylindrospermopsis raciborskii CS-505]OHY39848.1 hypothetical protein BCV63_11930 [Cylindrospermopsis raciborskii CS-508]